MQHWVHRARAFAGKLKSQRCDSICQSVIHLLTGDGLAQVQHTSGYVCVAMTGQELDRLGVPLMVPPPQNEEALRTAFTVTVDLRAGTTTGISAADRCPVACPSSPPSQACAPSLLSASLQRCFTRSGVLPIFRA